MEPIRVLHIVTYMGRGGLESMIMNYYRHIDRSRVQFDFLVHRDFESDYDQEILSLGGRIHHISRLVPWSRSYRAELKQFFKNHPEYKIVHVHQDCLSSVALKCAKECGIPIRIAHSHSSSQDKNLKYPIKLFYRQYIPKYSTSQFACSKSAGDWMFCGTPYIIINNAIDIQKYIYDPDIRCKVRKTLNIPQDSVVIGHVGRFNTVKNHTFLLDVFSNMKAKCKSAVLLLVGDGDLRSDIENKASALGLKDSIIFTGVRTDVPELMQAMDVFAFPSLYEGLPVTLIEAQASGLPCLVSDNVSIECKKTDLIAQYSLHVSASEWANQLLSMRAMVRQNQFVTLKNAGFDITENSHLLQNFYINSWKEN